jgi:hypothetical protein
MFRGRTQLVAHSAAPSPYRRAQSAEARDHRAVHRSGAADDVSCLLEHRPTVVIRIGQKLHRVIGLALQIDHRAFKHHGAPIQSLHHLLHMCHLLLLGTNDPAKLVHVSQRRLKSSDERHDEILDRRKHSHSLDDRGKAADRFLNLREAVHRVDDPRKGSNCFLDLRQDLHRVSDRP